MASLEARAALSAGEVWALAEPGEAGRGMREGGLELAR